MSQKQHFGGKIAENNLLVRRRSATKAEQSPQKRRSETMLSHGMR
jgi:hypothetical protein